MRGFGFVLLVAGVLGFYYCTQQLAGKEPISSQYSVEETLQTDQGKYEVGRFAAAGAALIGLLLALYPQGR
jgi:hypothetical protein